MLAGPCASAVVHGMAGYMEMTSAQARMWAVDVNEYVCDDEEVQDPSLAYPLAPAVMTEARHARPGKSGEGIP